MKNWLRSCLRSVIPTSLRGRIPTVVRTAQREIPRCARNDDPSLYLFKQFLGAGESSLEKPSGKARRTEFRTNQAIGIKIGPDTHGYLARSFLVEILHVFSVAGNARWGDGDLRHRWQQHCYPRHYCCLPLCHCW